MAAREAAPRADLAAPRGKGVRPGKVGSADLPQAVPRGKEPKAALAQRVAAGPVWLGRPEPAERLEVPLAPLEVLGPADRAAWPTEVRSSLPPQALLLLRTNPMHTR